MNDILGALELSALEQLQLAERDATFARSTLTALRSIRASYRANVATINADERLTTIAKQDDVAKIRDKAQREVAEFSDNILKRLSTRIEEFSAALKPDTVPADDVAATLLAIERRAVLRAQYGDDALMVRPVYLEAAERRDHVTVAAIETAAPFDTTFAIDPETKRQVKMIRARLSNPETFKALSELESLDALLRAAIHDVEVEVGVPDALHQAAFGKVPVDQGGPLPAPSIGTAPDTSGRAAA